MAVGAVNRRVVGILPKLQVTAAWLLANQLLGFAEDRQECRDMLNCKGHAYNSDKHTNFKNNLTSSGAMLI